MKKSDEIRRKTWRMIAKNLIVLAALAVAAVIGVMSWFTHKTSAKAEGISASTKMPDSLQFAIVEPSESDNEPAADSSEWKNGTVTLNVDNYDFLRDLFMCEVTGDGVEFHSPALTQVDGVAIVDDDEDSTWGTPTENREYISFDLYLRSLSQITVYLDDDTTIAPISTLSAGTAFSEDTAVGAVRFSVTHSGASVPDLLWIPAPNVYFDADNKSVITGIVSDTQTYGALTHTHTYFNSSKVRNTIDSTASYFKLNDDQDYTLGDKVPIATLTSKSSKSGNFYVTHVRCNLWLEGEDAEARLAMVGGKFTMALNLTI